MAVLSVAVLFDTSAAVLLLRRRAPDETAGLVRAARAEIEQGSALLPAVAAAELLIGERRPAQGSALAQALERLPTAVLPAEAAISAGAMGAFLAAEGVPVPLPDLLIAATAIWLEVPLLAWDGDYPRSTNAAAASPSDHPGAELWRRLELHPASRLDWE